MNILLLIPLHIFQKMASVEPILNMVLNKPEEDTLEEVPPSPQPSPPAENTPWSTSPPCPCVRHVKESKRCGI